MKIPSFVRLGYCFASSQSKSFSISTRLYSSIMSSSDHQFVIHPFCLRQFVGAGENSSRVGSSIPMEAYEFEKKVNEIFNQGGIPLTDGYAPFCKHLFIPNFLPDLSVAYTPLTEEVKKHVQYCYDIRQEGELPVLSVYVPKDTVEAPKATHLDIILYSREQINLEDAAMDKNIPTFTAPWGIVSVKPQLGDVEVPMLPITILRNALGAEEGGSGVALDRIKYQESVDFWKNHINIK